MHVQHLLNCVVALAGMSMVVFGKTPDFAIAGYIMLCSVMSVISLQITQRMLTSRRDDRHIYAGLLIAGYLTLVILVCRVVQIIRYAS